MGLSPSGLCTSFFIAAPWRQTPTLCRLSKVSRNTGWEPNIDSHITFPLINKDQFHLTPWYLKRFYDSEKNSHNFRTKKVKKIRDDPSLPDDENSIQIIIKFSKPLFSQQTESTIIISSQKYFSNTIHISCEFTEKYMNQQLLWNENLLSFNPYVAKHKNPTQSSHSFREKWN